MGVTSPARAAQVGDVVNVIEPRRASPGVSAGAPLVATITRGHAHGPVDPAGGGPPARSPPHRTKTPEAPRAVEDVIHGLGGENLA